jgi:hypothetical protein
LDKANKEVDGLLLLVEQGFAACCCWKWQIVLLLEVAD